GAIDVEVDGRQEDEVEIKLVNEDRRGGGRRAVKSELHENQDCREGHAKEGNERPHLLVEQVAGSQLDFHDDPCRGWKSTLTWRLISPAAGRGSSSRILTSMTRRSTSVRGSASKTRFLPIRPPTATTFPVILRAFSTLLVMKAVWPS